MRGPLHSSRLAPCGVLLATIVAGCGSGASYKNNPRPPGLIVITAAITPDRVAVSPIRFGGGPINLVVTNQTSRSRRLTLERNEVGKTPYEQQTAPINPHDTATLKAVVDQGRYSVRVTGGGVRPASLHVGPERPSAQNQLLQP